MLPIPFAGGLVLLHEERQRLFALNSTAAAIWTVLDLGLSTDDAAAVLAKHSGLDAAACAADIDAMQQQWRDDRTFDPEPWDHAEPPREATDPGPARYYALSGATFSFGSEDADIRTRVDAALAELAAPEAPGATALFVRVTGDGTLDLLVDGTSWLTTPYAGDIVGGVFQCVLAGANPQADWLVMLHAGALMRGSTAVVLPGPSGAGKSTLIGYLARRGFTYLSDDLAAIRTDGHVVPWPTPLSIKRRSWPVLAGTYPELEALPEEVIEKRLLKRVPLGRAAWDRPSAPVGMLVLPRWSRSKPPATQKLDPQEALSSLIEDRVWLGWPMTEAHVRRFLDWLESVPVYRIWYSDLDDAQERMEDLLRSTS